MASCEYVPSGRLINPISSATLSSLTFEHGQRRQARHPYVTR
jgi:hypothetical protein